MTHNPFAPQFKDLPPSLPIFPLSSVLLLPHGELPLNIFEPRYKAMVEAALRSHRMIGMIQPVNEKEKRSEVVAVGCAGKITQFAETDDGRYIITLSGISRFRVVQELEVTTDYRQVEADWQAYRDDLEKKECLDIDRQKLKDLLREYFELQGLLCDWQKIEDAGDQSLITVLSMVCPLTGQEKQALLEAESCKARADMFKTMLEIIIREQKSGTDYSTKH